MSLSLVCGESHLVGEFEIRWMESPMSRSRFDGSFGWFSLVGCCVMIVALSMQSQAQATRVWLIMEADLASRDIAGDMEVNVNSLDRLFRNNVGKNRLTIFDTQRQFGRQTVVSKLNQVARSMGPTDAVIFFYCGHGAYDRRYGTYFQPSLDSGRPLYLSEVRGMIGQLHPRLSVTVLDCCNTYAGPVFPLAPLSRPMRERSVRSFAVSSSTRQARS